MIDKKIESIDFGLLGPEVIRKMSTVRIVTPDTYDDDGYPIEGGLMDLRLGVIDPGLRCKTCGGRMTVCAGHFGHIELIRPVMHIGYVKMVLTLLRSTCKKCGKVLLPQEEINQVKGLMLTNEQKLEDEERSLDMLEKSKFVTTCPHCHEKQEKIKLIRPTTFYEGDQRLFPSQVRERLERIDEADLKMFGINITAAKPEWGILTVLPVPPATTRPSITLETGERSEDDLTHKLVDVLRINQRLADNISAGAPQLIIEDLWDLLQYHVTTYFNNEASGIPPARHRTGRSLKTLYQRLKGKEGRFRYYLSGKRVNFSARTVISPDPELSITQVGVPNEIAEELTVPIRVTEWNIDEIKKLVKRDTYPQVNYVIRADGRRKKITPLNKEEVLAEIVPDYIVERQLMDDDVVLFNRQPSLHRQSILAHRVKVMPGKTFRFNDAVSEPYNADFDGDEMNLHVPQTEEAMMEAKSLMSVPSQIVSIRHGQPLITGKIDHVTGTYMLTRKETELDQKQAQWLMSKVGISELPNKKKFTGKELLSMIIPENINIEYKSKLCRHCGTCDKEKCPYEAFVVIEKGKVKSGAVEGKGVKDLLMREIFWKNGPDAAAKFVDDITMLSVNALMITGFTTSLEEGDLPEEVRKKLDQVLSDAEKEVDVLIEKFNNGKLERVPGKSKRETLEDLVMAELAKARDLCGRITEKSLGKDNSDVIMATVGAKGNILNLTQMSACLGQTALRGKRILRGYKKKVLPHYQEDNISAEARGFIKSSYSQGLTPIEYFYHSMSGRDGMVDKGIRTAQSGYMQRRLINAMLDTWLRTDRSTRDAAGNVVQFKYGEDGVDPTHCNRHKPIDVDRLVRESE